MWKNYLLWAALALPAIIVMVCYVRDVTGYGATLSLTGRWAVWLLLATLAISPLRAILRRLSPSRSTAALLRLRRPMGVAMFGYAALHMAVYLERKADIARILSDSRDMALWTGWLAFVILIPLVVTSTNRAVRRLGRGWSRLHLWIYPAAVLSLVHWIMTAFDPTIGWINAGVLAVLLAWRLRRKAAR